MSETSVGFIGLGLMGAGMAKNILTKGFPLTVLAHKRREAIDRLVGMGAREVTTPREMAEQCDVIVLCVTGSREVEAVVLGEHGLATAGRPLIICDCSTADPSSTLRLAEELRQHDIRLVDAPLSRTPKDAEAGTLDVMAGGDDDTCERVRPILETFSQRIVRTGPVGTGHTMKLLNNFLSLGYAALYAEALALGAKAGLTPAVLDGVVRDGRMDCGFYRSFMDYVLTGNREAHKFTLRNALKDLSYLNAFANSESLANPMGASVRNSYAVAVGLGRGDMFIPMLSDVVADLNGVSLTPAADGKPS